MSFFIRNSAININLTKPRWNQARCGERERRRVASYAVSGAVTLHPGAVELLNGRFAKIGTNQNIPTMVQDSIDDNHVLP